jgi:hypothetical protein
MSSLRETAQQALEVLVRASSYYDTYAEIAALEAALAEPVQEPVACNACVGSIAHVQHGLPIGTKLFTHPPRREWRGLTDEEIRDLWSWSATAEAERTATTQQHAFARAIEAALKERNA